MTPPPPPAHGPRPESMFVEQQKRREALIERLGYFADLLACEPIEGEKGDVAYDLLREAAAQISSDRQHIAALLPTDADRESPRGAIGEIIRDVCELPGDTDPNDPDYVCLTVPELQVILDRHLGGGR